MTYAFYALIFLLYTVFALYCQSLEKCISNSFACFWRKSLSREFPIESKENTKRKFLPTWRDISIEARRTNERVFLSYLIYLLMKVGKKESLPREWQTSWISRIYFPSRRFVSWNSLCRSFLVVSFLKSQCEKMDENGQFLKCASIAC